jgi:hypothetical protein
MAKLTIPQQRALYKALSTTNKKKISDYCKKCEQSGEGVKEILKKIKGVLGPLLKEYGPKVLKEIIMPLLMKKTKEYVGLGLSVAGGSLKLAGQGDKKKKQSRWIQHVKCTAAKEGISYREAMTVAKATYKK